MSEPNPLEGCLDQVLSDPSLKDELSGGNRTAMKALFGNLFADVHQVTQATTVIAIHGNTWQIDLSQQSPRIIQLAGLLLDFNKGLKPLVKGCLDLCRLAACRRTRKLCL